MELSGPKDSSTRQPFCPSLHVRQTPSPSTLIKGPKLLHHLQQRAGCLCRAIASQQRSPSSISCSPVVGVTVSPCTYQTGSGLCCYCTHCCALPRRDIRGSLVVSFLLPLSRPSNRGIKFNRDIKFVLIAQHNLQDAACAISFQLSSLQ